VKFERSQRILTIIEKIINGLYRKVVLSGILLRLDFLLKVLFLIVRMIASSPLNHIFIPPLKLLVDSSQEKLKKRNILECFVSVKLPGYFNSKSESKRYFHWI